MYLYSKKKEKEKNTLFYLFHSVQRLSNLLPFSRSSKNKIIYLQKKKKVKEIQLLKRNIVCKPRIGNIDS